MWGGLNLQLQDILLARGMRDAGGAFSSLCVRCGLPGRSIHDCVQQTGNRMGVWFVVGVVEREGCFGENSHHGVL